MMELTTAPVNGAEDNKYNLFGAYVDYDGKLQSFDFDMTATIESNLNTPEMWADLVKDYQTSIVKLRGLSTYETFTNTEIKCAQFTVKSDKAMIKTKESFAACYGSIRECLTQSLQHEMCERIYSTGQRCHDAKVELTPSVAPLGAKKLNLIVFGDNGFEVVRGHLYHEFYEDRNPTCATCIDGFQRYEEAINKINSFLIANTDKAVYEGEYIHDFKLGSDKEIAETIYETFFTIIELAKIKTLRFERIKD